MKITNRWEEPSFSLFSRFRHGDLGLYLHFVIRILLLRPLLAGLQTLTGLWVLTTDECDEISGDVCRFTDCTSVLTSWSREICGKKGSRSSSWNAPAWWPLSQIHLADILHVWTPQCHLREHWDGGQFGIDSLQVRDWWSPFRWNCRVHNRTCALREPPLELTPRVSPSAQARWEIESHRTTCDERWPLWWWYSSSLPPTTPAEWQSMERKGQLKVKKTLC